MNTIVIEILRIGQSKAQYLQKDNNYIALCGTEPAKDFVIACNQDEFENKAALLRYNDANNEQRQSAIVFFQSLISQIISQIFPEQLAQQGISSFLHLRLVTSPKEIAQLPFEMALTPLQLADAATSKPFFINPELKTTFTREVRKVFFAHYFWPVIPRILFISAQPNNSVPHAEHLNAFVKLLTIWSLPLPSSPKPIPDIGKLLTIEKNGSLEKIKNHIAKAIEENKPYTHIHILAHGAKNPNADETPFLLVLNDNVIGGKPQYVSGEELSEALIIKTNEIEYCPPIVSLVACDSGNTGDPIHPVGSLAQHLHQNGIPCVFASQFPLTQDGSVKLVTALYSRLLQTSDPRIALYDTRIALASDNVHDWASLVAYARFPEDINEQMKNVQLKIWLHFIETVNALADHINKNISSYSASEIEMNFREVEQRFNWSIENLVMLIDAYKNDKLNKEFHVEHYGLIGSAFKRKAENSFNLSNYYQHTPVNYAASIKLLQDARDWYFKGYRYLNSHWNGTQYLSLLAILEEQTASNKNYDIWNLCRIMAENDEMNAVDESSEAWACGTLAELYLLESFFVVKSDAEKEIANANAQKYLLKLKATAASFPKESTKRQLQRYVNWWGKLSTNKNMEQLLNKIPEHTAIF